MKVTSIFCFAAVSRAQLPASTGNNVTSSTHSASQEATNAASASVSEDQMEWCRHENVSQKDCAEWIADQMARKAARAADEAQRKAERKKDEEARADARKADEDARMAARNSEDKARHEARTADEAPRMAANVEKREQEAAATQESSGAGPDVLMESMLSLAETEEDNVTSATHSASQEAADAAGASVSEDQAEWCRHENVSQRECADWVADQMARKAARAADEAQRKAERKADEDARKANEDARMAARNSDDRARHEARTADEALRMAARKADATIRKASVEKREQEAAPSQEAFSGAGPTGFMAAPLQIGATLAAPGSLALWGFGALAAAALVRRGRRGRRAGAGEPLLEATVV